MGTVFLEVGTARKKALRLDCCSMCSRNWREVGKAEAECVREKRGSERGQDQLRKREDLAGDTQMGTPGPLLAHQPVAVITHVPVVVLKRNASHLLALPYARPPAQCPLFLILPQTPMHPSTPTSKPPPLASLCPWSDHPEWQLPVPPSPPHQARGPLRPEPGSECPKHGGWVLEETKEGNRD